MCAATRLARFNVQTKTVDSRWFVGLPTPAGAGAICSLLFFAPDREWQSWSAGVLLAALIVVGTLMVSTFRYWSFKRIDLKRRWSYRIALPLAAGIFVVALDPPAFFLVLAVIYTASGPIAWLFSRWRAFRSRDSEPTQPTSQDTPKPEPWSVPSSEES